MASLLCAQICTEKNVKTEVLTSVYESTTFCRVTTLMVKLTSELKLIKLLTLTFL